MSGGWLLFQIDENGYINEKVVVVEGDANEARDRAKEFADETLERVYRIPIFDWIDPYQ
jgi:hypothetical protein